MSDLVLSLQRDDGIIAYIDGKEVVRDNVNEGPAAHDLFADHSISGDAETVLHRFPFAAIIHPGKHVLTISLHNRKGGSSDLRLAEVSLIGILYRPKPPEPPESDE